MLQRKCSSSVKARTRISCETGPSNLLGLFMHRWPRFCTNSVDAPRSGNKKRRIRMRRVEGKVDRDTRILLSESTYDRLVQSNKCFSSTAVANYYE